MRSSLMENRSAVGSSRGFGVLRLLYRWSRKVLVLSRFPWEHELDKAGMGSLRLCYIFLNVRKDAG